ncbi:little elongation complex subunit 2-like isoform X1 [Asterias rubens]|uniref:little elongation complex subunit 2-like isoform X1 n=1 Tax=Asterias rubens TaxID=7604 RepID=UPI0014559C75|nr:little elongation complex subunit 2-like isoform X1 [Asterias rubens]
MSKNRDASAFFTEDEYENFSLKPRFDIELFQAYDARAAEGGSPLKKRKPSNTKQRNPATSRSHVILPGQPIQSSRSLSDQIHKGVNVVPQDHLKPKRWTLKSPKPQCPYPRFSSLTHAQQQLYIALWQKHGLRHSNQSRYTTSPELITEKQQLRKLQITVHKEQQDFMKYAERVARSNPKDYEQLSPQAMQFLQKHWLSQEKRVKNLPQHYSLHQTVGIVSSNVFPSDPVLTFGSRLLVLGEQRIVDESTIDRKLHHNVATAFQIQSQTKPAATRNTDTKSKELIDDQNVVKLATKYQANVVIATASLATLADNHAPDFDKNWQIPIHVKSTRLPDAEVSVKTVYISDPLTNAYYPHEGSRTFHSAVLSAYLTQNATTESYFSNHDSESDEEVTNESQKSPEISNNYFDSQELDLSNLETFGSTVCKSDKKTLKQTKVSLKPGGASEESDVKIQCLDIAKEEHQPALVTSLIKTESQPTMDKTTQEILGDTNINRSILPHSPAPNNNRPQVLNKTPSDIISSDGKKTHDKIGTTSPSSSDSEISAHESLEYKEEKSSHTSSNLETSCQRSMMFGVSSDSSAQPRQEVSILNQSTFKVERNEFALESDVSEGELMIALSSDPESPQIRKCQDNLSLSSIKTQFKQYSVDNTPQEEIKSDCAQENQQSASERTANRPRKRHISSELTTDALSAPRRSCRLKKLHQPETATQPTSSTQSEDSACSSVKNTSDKKPNSKTESSLISKKDALITDSPLSPPPSQKGVDHGSLSHTPQARGATLVPESPMSPPFQDQRGKTLVMCCPSDPETSPHSPDANHKEMPKSDVENLIPCKRYNLRSKNVTTGSEEAVVAALSKAADSQNQNYPPSSNTDPAPSSDTMNNIANISDNSTATREEPTPIIENENSTKVSKTASHQAITQPHETKTQKRLPVKTRANKQSKTTGEESTMDSILKLQQKLHSSKMENQSPPKPLITIPCVQGQSDLCVEDPSTYKSEMDGRVDYTLWRFGKLNILVRSDIDAVSAPSGVTNLNKGQVTSILSKMEFQPHFGFEQISVSELTKLWISLLLQPGSKVIQGRMNALTSDLILLEHFDMHSSIWEQPSFQPSQCMKMISQVLDKLTSLSEGHYLLCHSAGDMHVCILQSTTNTGKSRSPYDLHKSHIDTPMMQPCPPPLLPWLPLDTNLILPSQMAAGRIPATFPPKNMTKNVKGDVANNVATKKKKKKKKKKVGKT